MPEKISPERLAELERERLRLITSSFVKWLRFAAHTIDHQDEKGFPVLKPYPVDVWWELPVAELMEKTQGDPKTERRIVLYIIKSRQIRRTWCLSHYYAWILFSGKNENTAIFSIDLDRADRQNLERTWVALRHVGPWVKEEPYHERTRLRMNLPHPVNGAKYFLVDRKKHEITLHAYDRNDRLLYRNYMRALVSPRGENLTFAAIDEAAHIPNFAQLLNEEIRPAHTWKRPIIVQSSVKGKNAFDMEAYNETEDGLRVGKVNPDELPPAFDPPDDVPPVCADGVKLWTNYRGDKVLLIKCFADPWKAPGTEWWTENIELGGERARQEYLCDRDIVIDETKAFPEFSVITHTYSVAEERYPELAKIIPEVPLIRSWDPGWHGMAATLAQKVGNTLVFHKSWLAEQLYPEEFVRRVVYETREIVPEGAVIIETGDVKTSQVERGPRPGREWSWQGVIERVVGSVSGSNFFFYHLQRRPNRLEHIRWIRELLRLSEDGRPFLVINDADDGLKNALRYAVLNIPAGGVEPNERRPLKPYHEAHIKDCIAYTIALTREHPYFQSMMRTVLPYAPELSARMGMAGGQNETYAFFGINYDALNEG